MPIAVFPPLNTNSRSLIRNKETNEMLLECFRDGSNFQFDVLRFSETWHTPEIESLVALQSYNPVFKNK